ncbi:MAG TPA: hypothetical protein DDY91_05035 [Planctomycetaceae bacterium]|nr:hypothetical protein [Planctomycetaceae bacterium]
MTGFPPPDEDDQGDWAATIRAIHASTVRLVLAITGGGAGAISRLLEVPGASRSVLEGRVPYFPAALAEWLGRPPEQACSLTTALGMAAVAERRARQLDPETPQSPEGTPHWLGVAGTSALVSDRPKKGEHRCHLAVHSSLATHAVSVTLAKGLRSRMGEERLVADLLLSLIAEQLGIEPPVIELQEGGDTFTERRVEADPLERDLLAQARDVVWRRGAEPGEAQPRTPIRGVLPGSFNPVHAGHRQLQQIARRKLQGEVAWEISVVNVDKPPLDLITLEERCAQFAGEPVVLTRSPLFAQKAAVMPGMVFVVGADTAARLVDPRYYAGDPETMSGSLKTIRDQGCRFLVAGRVQDGQYVSLGQLPIPNEFQGLFEEIPAEEFRCDLSSTELRRQRQAADGG